MFTILIISLFGHNYLYEICHLTWDCTSGALYFNNIESIENENVNELSLNNIKLICITFERKQIVSLHKSE